jgi:hypothetical protein
VYFDLEEVAEDDFVLRAVEKQVDVVLLTVKVEGTMMSRTNPAHCVTA